MLRVTRVEKSFGGQSLFRGADWFLGPRARVSLVGPNGSGKSTLLRIVAGLESADRGRIEMPKGLRLGYLAQTGFTVGEGTVRQEARRAFDEILELQARLERIEARLARPGESPEDLQRLTVEQSEIHDRLAVLGADDVERQVYGVLKGLGFREEEFDRPIATLSGGWQMRAALARILLQRPELLLLDEPTNHLDLEAREWLEGYLRDYPYAFVLVSHDRYFLDVTVHRVTEITAGCLEDYDGNYTFFESERRRRLDVRRQAYERQQDEIRRIQRFIDRFRYKNTKAPQVQSRIKYLEKMERLEPPESPGRGMVMPRPISPRSGKTVLELRSATKAYGDLRVLDQVDLRIHRGRRVALVGPNGAGKSTLMRLLAGVETPDAGERRAGHNVLPAFFAQDHSALLDPRHTVLEAVTLLAPNDFIPQVRGLLGAFLFSGDAVDKRISVLSGGERNRLALARLFVRPANLLLLDEPTNHLDIQSKEVLLTALKAFEGTVVFVSHDRHFLDALADHIIEIGGGGVREHPGDYESYVWRCRQEGDADTAAAVRPAVAKAAKGKRPEATRRGEAESRAQRAAARRRGQRLAELEEQIATLEDRKRRFSEVMGSPGFFAHQEKADLYLQQLEETERELADLYGEWETLAGD